ncbi:Aste57867_2744 [Aphanomyces stellatus]|uniref:Aste57867_2744 protein n=1 Tax=Aphanomyces stellatus TaxID=120398 RepID=A0A485K871_9STRA|nr:hypothetical protein As57867_002737 [Aphanomyces stellatus]VFT79936.1 Aste57867_2744 [Aphanomyces stellatus]
MHSTRTSRLRTLQSHQHDGRSKHDTAAVDDAEAWIYRLVQHYGFTKPELLLRLCGDFNAHRVPLDHICSVMNELEPSMSCDPLSGPLQDFWYGFALPGDDWVIDAHAALDSIWYDDEIDSSRDDIARRPRHGSTARDSAWTGTRHDPSDDSTAGLIQALGPKGIETLEVGLQHTPRLRIPDLYERIADIAPHVDMMSAEAFYEICQPYCDADGLVQLRPFLRAIQLPTHDPALGALRAAVAHLTVTYLEDQCAMFDMEDDGWISLAECVSVLHALPDVALTPLEIERGLRSLAQPDQRIAYKDACAVLGRGVRHQDAEKWRVLRRKLCDDNPATALQIQGQLERIFHKLSTHPSRCMVTAGHLQRVLGSLLSASELQWIHATLATTNDHVDADTLLVNLFPVALSPRIDVTNDRRSFSHSPRRVYFDHDDESHLDGPGHRGRAVHPFDGLPSQRSLSTSPTRKHMPVYHHHWSLSPRLHTSTTSPSNRPQHHRDSPSKHQSPTQQRRTDDAMLQQLREMIQHRQINLLVLNDSTDANGNIPLAAAVDRLWHELERHHTLTYVQLQHLLGRFSTKHRTRLNLAALLDGLFDWARLRNVTTQSLESLLDAFETYKTSHPGYIRWHPDFQDVLHEMFHIEWLPWEQQVICHRFGVTIHHEMWIDFRAFVKHLAHVPQKLWPLVLAHSDFNDMDPTHKGYVDRADLKTFLERYVLQRVSTPHEVAQVWKAFLKGDPSATVIKKQHVVGALKQLAHTKHALM